MTLVLTARGVRRSLLSCLVLATGAGILAGACGGDGGSAPSAPPPAPPTPAPPPPPPPPACTVGLILRAGDSCTYPGTSQTLTINADGTATFGSVTDGARINISSNDVTLAATRQSDGSWLVQQVGAESLNRAPRAVGSIPDQALTDGGAPATIELSGYFEDPDGDGLTYRASSSRTSVVRVSVSGSEITLTPRGEGTATVTVTATDPDGRSATQRFDVTVGAGMASGPAAEAELTSCPATTSGAGHVRFTLRGRVTAHRRLTDVRVHGCAGTSLGDSCEDEPFDFDYIGTDHLGTIEAGRSKEFEISGSPRIPVVAISGLRYHCWVWIQGRQGGATLAGAETGLTVHGIETRLPPN